MNIKLMLVLLGIFGLVSCQSGHVPIDYGKIECVFCKMIIMDKRFGCEIINKHGKAFMFDDLSCLFSYKNSAIRPASIIKAIYIPDYLGDHTLSKANTLYYVASEMFKSPMAGNVAAFSNKDSAEVYAKKYKGQLTTWNKINKHD
jgi:copper chaperone NosL